MQLLGLFENLTCGFCDCSEFGALNVSRERQVLRFEIEYYLEDAQITVADGIEHRILRDYIQIAKPGQTRYSMLPFSTMYIKFNVSGTVAAGLSRAPEYFPATQTRRIKSLLESIIIMSESNAANEIMLCSRTLELISAVLDDSQIHKPSAGMNYRAVEQAKGFIEKNYAEHITLDQIAAQVHLSATYLHSIFKQLCGVTPHEYLTEQRVNAVKRMLWNTATDIGTVAQESGFGCQQYLNRIFKQKTGLTPCQYRKRFQQNYFK